MGRTPFQHGIEIEIATDQPKVSRLNAERALILSANNRKENRTTVHSHYAPQHLCSVIPCLP